MEDKEILQNLIKNTNEVRKRNSFLLNELNRYKSILYHTKKLNRRKKKIICEAIQIALENNEFREKYGEEAKNLVRWIR